MITVKVEGIERVNGKLSTLAKQSRYAAAVALTNTARIVDKQLRAETQAKFSNPSPWIVKGTVVERATKAKLQATVGFRERQSLYVKEHFLSGFRGQKPYERALTNMGLLPSGYRAVPGAGLKLDARGIPNRSQLTEMFGALKSGTQVYKGKGKRMQAVGYFAIPIGSASHLSPGIYWRAARAIKPILIFVRSAEYEKIFDLDSLAGDIVNREFKREFDVALANALRTAR